MKIRVKPIFWVAVIIVSLLGYAEDFFMMLLFAMVHEGGHIAAAWIFGRKCGKFSITPIGVYAEIEGYYEAEPFEGICIAAAGPAVNIIIAVACRYMGLMYIYDINVALAAFNLLTIYPLDGGRIVKYICECFMGVTEADRIVMRCAYMGAVLLVGIGVLQVVLFPYNISLISLGKYLMKVIEEEKVWLKYRFFQGMKGKMRSGKVMKIRKYAIDEDTGIKDMTGVMGNWYYCVFVRENGDEISEREILKYMEEYGMIATAGEIFAKR